MKSISIDMDQTNIMNMVLMLGIFLIPVSLALYSVSVILDFYKKRDEKRQALAQKNKDAV